MRLRHWIDTILQQLSLGLIWVYQLILSPDKGIPSLRLKGRICMHEPHCSEYGKLCLQRYGFFHSIGKITHRVFSCTGGMHKIYDPEFYKVVFFSSAPIGVPFLEKLHADKRFDITGVVTMPDAPAGRGMKMQENVVKTYGKTIHTDIQTPNSLRLDSKKYADEAQAFEQWLIEKKPDFLVVIAYGKIIPQHILDIPTFGPINVHGSLLPKYRGASPIQSVFLHDEQETGITIMKIDAGLDTGDMIDTAKFPIAFDWTAKDVISKMQEVGPQFLVDTLRKYGKGLLGEVKQDDTQATHCGKIEKEDGLIDPYTDSLQSIYNKYRAYILWPKIYWMHGDKRVILEQLVLDEALFAEHKEQPLITSVIARNEGNEGRGNPGHNKYEQNPSIQTLTVKPEGSKSQSWDDFVKGYM